MKVALVLAALLLAGCSASAPETSPHDDEVRYLSLDLSDFTSDALALEIIPEADGQLVVHVARDLLMTNGQPVSGAGAAPDVCMGLRAAGQTRADFHVRAGGGVAVAAAGQDGQVTLGPGNAHVLEPVRLEVRVKAGEALPVQIALHHATEWRALGGGLELTIEASEGFRYQRMPDPAFQCVTGPQDFVGGTWADSGVLRTIRGQEAAFAVSAPSTVLALVSADIRYDYTFEDGRGSVVHGDRLEVGSMGFQAFFAPLAPDDYALRIHELTGTNTVGFPTLAVAAVIEETPVAA